MQPERWDRIQEIFESAVDAEATQREKIVREACGSDLDLFGEVMALLAADSEGHSLLDRENVFESLPGVSSLSGVRLGPFLLKREVGAGGMGSVYLGERVDGQFQQSVAVKVIQPGLGTAVIVRRFQQERQILARLQHPHIARILDGGLTPDGRPYFVMEFVDGEPIDQYCRDRSLPLEERLSVFLQACEAVEYAHSHLVIHRDIKPANVLVGKDGQVKLLDFGIAKVLEGSDASGSDPGLTQTGFRALTPRYASPEQLRNGTLTTTSDVYSLGVVLFELLTGRHPYQKPGDSAAELEYMVKTQDPERPSSAVMMTTGNTDPGGLEELRKLRRHLRGDLDTICLAALRKDPDKRYATVRQLADDIRSYLGGWPIQARMDSVPYMLNKFVRRHQAIVASAGLALLALGVTIGFYTRRLAQERDRARLEARKAQEVSEFLTGIFELSDPNVSRGESITAREMLDRATERLRVELVNQPEVRATMLQVASEIHYNVGLYFESRNLADEAAGLRKLTLGENHVDYATTLDWQALLLDEAAERDSALVLARRALTIMSNLDPALDSAVALCQLTMAYIHRHQGEFDSAEYYYRHALETQRRILGDAHPDVGNTLNHMGRLYSQRGQYAEAEPYVRQAIANQRANYNTDEHFEVLASMGNLGGILVAQNRYAEAESVFVHVRLTLARMAGTDHAFYGGMTNQLAHVVYKQGRTEEARRLFTESLESARQNLPVDHPGHVGALLGLGRLMSEHQEADAAEQLLREALVIRERSLPADHWQIATAASLLADCLRRSKKFDEAAPLARHSFEVLNQKFGPEDSRTLEAQKVLEAISSDGDRPLPVVLP